MQLVHIVVEPIGEALGGGARFPDALYRALADAGVSQRVLLAARDAPTRSSEILGNDDLPQLSSWIDQNTWLLVHSPDTQGLAVAERLRGRHPELRIAAVDLGGMTLSTAKRAIPGRIRYRNIDVAFAISEYSRRQLPLPGSRTSTIYGGGDHILLVPPEGRFSMVDFTFVGRVLPHKGLDTLLDALPESSAVRCIGPSSSWEAPHGRHIRNRLDEVGGEACSDLTDSQLRTALTMTRWLVLPTLGRSGWRRLRRPELFGLVVAEAAALGTPSIVSRVGALPEIAQMVGARVCEGTSVRAWSAELEAALDDDRSASLPPQLTWPAVARGVVDRLWKDKLP